MELADLIVRVFLFVFSIGLLLFRVVSKSTIARLVGPLGALGLLSSVAHYAVAKSLPVQIWGPILLVLFGTCIAWAIYEARVFTKRLQNVHTDTNTK